MYKESAEHNNNTDQHISRHDFLLKFYLKIRITAFK